MSRVTELFDLSGRVAVVTGASSGLGEGFARALASCGATVVAAARRTDRLERLAEELPGLVPVVCDITSAADRQRLVETALAAGGLDILVNNAGKPGPPDALTETEEELASILDVNLTAGLRLSVAAVAALGEDSALSIINISSVVGLVSTAPIGGAGYAASKAGLIGATRELAGQWGRRGVRVNALVPGWFDTEMTDGLFANEKSAGWVRRNTMLGRGGQTGEVDGALLFLASDASSYVTGHTLVVDGGWVAMSGVALALAGAELPATMKAVRLIAWGAPPELVELAVPAPVAGELLLRVDAAGLCHSDLHVMDAAPGTHPYTLPFTLGHEVVGTVVATGPDADPVWLGVTAAVHGVWSCGECRACRIGRDNYCTALTGPIGAGLGYDGGLAEYLLVPTARHLVAAPGVDPAQLAPLTDAGLTAYHAVRDHLADLAGAAVAVIGVGGLGHLAVQLLAQHGAATLVAVDPRPEAAQLALRLGATAAVAEVGELAEALPEGRADLIVDFVGAPATVATLAEHLAPGGDFVLVGSAGAALSVGKTAGLQRGWSVSAPFWGPHADLAAVVGLAERGTIRAEVERFTLDEAASTYERLRAGHVAGRAVVLPHG